MLVHYHWGRIASPVALFCKFQRNNLLQFRQVVHASHKKCIGCCSWQCLGTDYECDTTGAVLPKIGDPTKAFLFYVARTSKMCHVTSSASFLHSISDCSNLLHLHSLGSLLMAQSPLQHRRLLQKGRAICGKPSYSSLRSLPRVSPPLIFFLVVTTR